MSSEDDAQFDILTDVGSRLRAAREAKQLSLREIADTTKISITALEALEENDVARLPGGIYSRACACERLHSECVRDRFE